MNLFAIADPHLSFAPGVDKPMDVFGGEWVGHTQKLYKNWSEMVGPDDYVIIAGDISWGLKMEEAIPDLDWIRSLPGKKIFLKGNHDLWWSSLKKLNQIYGQTLMADNGFGDMVETVIPDPSMTFIQNGAVIIQDEPVKIAVCGTRGWICPGTDGFGEHDKKIYKREVGRLKASFDEAKKAGAEMIIAALHYPPTNDMKQPSDFTALCTEYGVKTCVYGHLHNKEGFNRSLKGVLNGVEYRLISLDYLEGKPIQVI